MEGLSSLKGLGLKAASSRRAPAPEPSSDDISSLISEDAPKQRVGGRQRAYNQFAEFCAKAIAEGWTIEQLAEYAEGQRDETKLATGNSKGTGGRGAYYVGVSDWGNRILVSGHSLLAEGHSLQDIKGDFVTLYQYGKKSEALDFVNSGENNTGALVF